MPTPAAARYKRAGDPRPPVPTANTELALSVRWPVTPTCGKIRCREYRRTSSWFSSGNCCWFVVGGGVDAVVAVVVLGIWLLLGVGIFDMFMRCRLRDVVVVVDVVAR